MEVAEAMTTYQEKIRELTRDPVTVIDAHPVYQKDSFRLAYTGRGPVVQHAPYLGADGRGALEGGYAIAWFADGTIRLEHVVAVEENEEKTLWLAVERLSRWFVPPSTIGSAGELPSATHREPLLTDLEDVDAAAAGLGDPAALEVDDDRGVLSQLPPVPRRRKKAAVRGPAAGAAGDSAGGTAEGHRASSDAVSVEEEG